jgi:hypothetical protein
MGHPFGVAIEKGRISSDGQARVEAGLLSEEGIPLHLQ